MTFTLESTWDRLLMASLDIAVCFGIKTCCLLGNCMEKCTCFNKVGCFFSFFSCLSSHSLPSIRHFFPGWNSTMASPPQDRKQKRKRTGVTPAAAAAAGRGGGGGEDEGITLDCGYEPACPEASDIIITCIMVSSNRMKVKNR